MWTNIGPNRNLIVTRGRSVEDPRGELDEWLSFEVYVPVRFDFVGDWDEDSSSDSGPFSNRFTRQTHFREKFESEIEWVWDPGFHFLGEERSFVFFQKKVRASVMFEVLDVERSSTPTVRKSQKITRVEVYPGSGSGAHTFLSPGIIMRVHEDDVNLKPTLHGNEQITVAHEMGHVLGYDHPICSGGANRCYGPPGSPESRDIMGVGMNADSKKKNLFVSLLNQTESKYSWSVEQERPEQHSAQMKTLGAVKNYPSQLAVIPGPAGNYRLPGRWA